MPFGKARIPKPRPAATTVHSARRSRRLRQIAREAMADRPMMESRSPPAESVSASAMAIGAADARWMRHRLRSR
jgi:hypothetical protein